MISLMPDRNFGALLKSRREASTDPTTGRPYTQARLAEAVSQIAGEEISRSLVGGWEQDASDPSAKAVNALARVPGLDMPVMESVIALGFDVNQYQLSELERDLLAALRRLRGSPALQETALRVVRALPAPPRQTRPTSPASQN